MSGHVALCKIKKTKKTYFEPGKPIKTPFVMLRELQKTSTVSDVIVIVETSIHWRHVLSEAKPFDVL